MGSLERAIDENSEKGYALNAEIEKAQREAEIVGDRKRALVASALGDTASLEAIEAAHAALAVAEKKKGAIVETVQALHEAREWMKQNLALDKIRVEDAVRKVLAVDDALHAVVSEFSEVTIRHANLLSVINKFSYEISILPKGSAARHTDTAGFLQPFSNAYHRLHDDPHTTLPNI